MASEDLNPTARREASHRIAEPSPAARRIAKRSVASQSNAPTRQQLNLAASEADWTTTVVDCALFNKWDCYHTHNSQRSNPGWPDWVFCRPPRLVLAELKTEQGSLSKAQRYWRELLEACPGVEYRCWRPSDWPDVEATLGTRP